MQEVELVLGANIDAWSCEVIIFFAGTSATTDLVILF
jgi:hypothetical protein